MESVSLEEFVGLRVKVTTAYQSHVDGTIAGLDDGCLTLTDAIISNAGAGRTRYLSLIEIQREDIANLILPNSSTSATPSPQSSQQNLTLVQPLSVLAPPAAPLPVIALPDPAPPQSSVREQPAPPPKECPVKALSEPVESLKKSLPNQKKSAQLDPLIEVVYDAAALEDTMLSPAPTASMKQVKQSAVWDEVKADSNFDIQAHLKLFDKAKELEKPTAKSQQLKLRSATDGLPTSLPIQAIFAKAKPAEVKSFAAPKPPPPTPASLYVPVEKLVGSIEEFGLCWEQLSEIAGASMADYFMERACNAVAFFFTTERSFLTLLFSVCARRLCLRGVSVAFFAAADPKAKVSWSLSWLEQYGARRCMTLTECFKNAEHFIDASNGLFELILEQSGKSARSQIYAAASTNKLANTSFAFGTPFPGAVVLDVGLPTAWYRKHDTEYSGSKPFYTQP